MAATKAPAKTQPSGLMEGWDPKRVQVYNVLHHSKFDAVMGSVILFNVVLMLLEADDRARCYPELCVNDILTNLNRGLLIFYTIEAAARMYMDQSKYFLNRWNTLDFCIVSFGYIDELLEVIVGNLPTGQVVPMLRMIRIARLLRALRILRFYPELYIMVKGFIGAMRAMFWGFVMIIILLVLWSLLFVEIVHPINYDLAKNDPEMSESCALAFSTIFLAALTLFQTLVAGDSWGSCAVPIIKENRFTFFLFAAALITIALGFMNLILAVIVDHAAAAREDDKEEALKTKREAEVQVIEHWKEVIKQMDTDGDGTITLQELLEGYEGMPEVNETLKLMGLQKKDLMSLFKLMDDDGSGGLDYDEFIDAFLQAQGMDPKIYLMMTKLQCDAMAKSVKRLTTDVGMGTQTMTMGRSNSMAPETVATLSMSRGMSPSTSPGGAGFGPPAASPTGCGGRNEDCIGCGGNGCGLCADASKVKAAPRQPAAVGQLSQRASPSAGPEPPGAARLAGGEQQAWLDTASAELEALSGNVPLVMMSLFQEKFDALAYSVESNTKILARQAELLEGGGARAGSADVRGWSQGVQPATPWDGMTYLPSTRGVVEPGSPVLPGPGSPARWDKSLVHRGCQTDVTARKSIRQQQAGSAGENVSSWRERTTNVGIPSLLTTNV